MDIQVFWTDSFISGPEGKRVPVQVGRSRRCLVAEFSVMGTDGPDCSLPNGSFYPRTRHSTISDYPGSKNMTTQTYGTHEDKRR